MGKKYIVSFVSAAALLTGCSGTAQEQAAAIFEKTAEAEASFVDQQQPLKKLEEKEQEIYQEIMNKGQKDEKQWKVLKEKAEKNLKEREEKLSAEREAMEKAADEFAEMKELKSDIQDEKAKEKLDELVKTANQRYKEHEKVSKLYEEVLQLNKELYGMLENKETKLAEAEEHIAKINEKNEKLQAANKRFNELTDTFNNQKDEFEKLTKAE